MLMQGLVTTGQIVSGCVLLARAEATGKVARASHRAAGAIECGAERHKPLAVKRPAARRQWASICRRCGTPRHGACRACRGREPSDPWARRRGRCRRARATTASGRGSRSQRRPRAASGRSRRRARVRWPPALFAATVSVRDRGAEAAEANRCCTHKHNSTSGCLRPATCCA